jgi:16S rRNA (uracil1498-N3)-methyltransferase
MNARFYAPDLAPGAEVVDLPDEESHHLAHVLRLGAGDEVCVFDGRGHEYRARVEQIVKGAARVRLLEPITPSAEPRVHATLAQAVLKSDHMNAVVRDATMMGVAGIQPVVTSRTQVSLSALRRGRAVERWRRTAIASVKQSRRAVVPAVHEPATFEQYLKAASAEERLCLMLVEPGVHAPALRDSDALLRLPRPSHADILVGPEGGWDEDEVDAALSAGCSLLTLGQRTLRADAAPVVAIAVLQFVWGDL